MAWVPIGAEPGFRETMVKGIPVWMEAPLDEWYMEYIGAGDTAWNMLVAFDLDAKNNPATSVFSNSTFSRMRASVSEEKILEFLDFVVYASLTDERDYMHLNSEDRAYALEGVLSASGSEWRVGQRNGLHGLEKRLAPAVQDATDMVVNGTGNANYLLSEAWHALRKRNPDAEEAYEKAVKAVEEAAIPVVLPKETTATLGKVLAAMRSQRTWDLPLTLKGEEGGPTMLISMIERLWKGQTSRHGANGYRKPTVEEADSAVMLAVVLVYWFCEGAVQRREAGHEGETAGF